MKKSIPGLLGGAAVLSMLATSAFAAGPGRGRNFVDANADGLCDNAAGACVYMAADGDGVCDDCAPGQGVCRRAPQRGCGNGFRGGRGR